MQNAFPAAVRQDVHERGPRRWILSCHICNTVSRAMDDMFDNEEDGEMTVPNVKHKEEGLCMRRLHTEDRAKIKKSSSSTRIHSQLLLLPR